LRSATLARCATGHDRPESLVTIAGIRILMLKKAKSDAGSESLRANMVKQMKLALDGTDIVRLEVRGKMLRGLPLYKLNSLPNRFALFKFADLNAAGAALPRLTERAFLAMRRQDGLKAALDAFKHTKQARKVNAYWRSHQASWWKPEPMAIR
jgi:hypothetical protein